MRITARGRSSEGVHLVQWRDPDRDVRIRVDEWLESRSVGGLYIERPRSVRLLWNYLWRVGIVAVVRKVRSRLHERARNRRVAGVGIGTVLEAPVSSGVRNGQRVVFVAPAHSLYWPVLTLDNRLVHQASQAYTLSVVRAAFPTVADRLEGWSRWSGAPLDTRALEEFFDAIGRGSKVGSESAESTGLSPARAPAFAERIETVQTTSGRPSAVLFGLGNYAKTQIVPQVRRYLDLRAVHEIDPDQLLAARRLGVSLDTSPEPRPEERYAAWFIAGFHSSHAPLAVRALMSGAFAVIEKPLATTRTQFVELSSVLRMQSLPRAFACFHRRYSQTTAWAVDDLTAAGLGPIDMHAIVFEIPLPRLHWYNWPSSGSRLISNGCHWIDLFLFMNGYSRTVASRVMRLRGTDLSVALALENGAQLTLTLTDCGSERLGVRDHVELRRRDITVTISDAARYHAENSQRVLRRGYVNPMRAYSRMYSSVCRRIAAGEPGDSLESLASTAVVLDLEESLSSGG